MLFADICAKYFVPFARYVLFGFYFFLSNTLLSHTNSNKVELNRFLPKQINHLTVAVIFNVSTLDPIFSYIISMYSLRYEHPFNHVLAFLHS